MSVATTIGRDVLNLPCRYEGAGGRLEQAAYISGHQDALLAAYGVIRDSPALAKLEASHESLLAACKAWVEYFDRLTRDDEPGDPLAAARNRYHRERIEKTRAAIAAADDE